MAEINIVTSFNETILKDTAIHLLNSTKENLDTDISFTCYYPDRDWETILISAIIYSKVFF